MKRITKIIALLVAALMLVSIFSGCKTTADVTGTTMEEEAPAAEMEESSVKDTLVMLSAESFTGSWDPTGHTVLANLHVEQLVFDRLWEVDWTSGSIDYVSRLATEWNYLDDGALEIKLRDGVKFHDGSDFDAEDVAMSIERYSNPAQPMGFFWAEQMVAEVVDELTVKLTTTSGEEYAPLINNLSFISMMSSEDIKDEEKLKSGLNGTGPFKFIKYENEQVDFKVNEDYWDIVPQIKKISFRYVADPATRLAALQSGEADLIERVESEQIPTIEADDNLEFMTLDSIEQKMLIFKWLVPPMNEQLVRQAIAYAIDKETIVNDIMQGYASVADSFVSSVAWGYAPAEGLPTYDPEKAKELLVEAGYPGGEGLPELTYLTSVGFYPKTKEYGEYIVSTLAEVGIKVKLVPMETASWLDSLYQLDPGHMIDTGWAPPALEPNITITSLYRSPGLISRAEDAELEEVIANESKIMDEDERKAYFKDVVFPMLAEKVPQLPLVNSMLIYAKSKDLQGFTPAPTSELTTIRNVYFKAE